MGHPPSYLERSTAPSTLLLAGRSRRSGGTDWSSASTGRCCSAASCFASCTTTLIATSGSSSGSMTDGSEAAVGGVSGLVRNLHEGCARVQIDAVVGAEPGPVAVGDRYEQRGDEAGRAAEDQMPRLRARDENELRSVVAVETSISTVDNLHDRVALQIRADHTGGGARSVEPWNPCAVHKAEPIDLVRLNFDAAEWIRVGRVHGPDPEGSIARAGLDVEQTGERL